MAFKRCRKQRKSIKLGHSSRYRLSRSRSFPVCNHQQSALGPLISRSKRNAETRDRVYAFGGSRRVSSAQGRAFAGMPQPSRVISPRSRVSALLTVATGRGNTCAWLIVAGSHRSATVRGLNGKMANLFRFAPFRDQVQVQSVPLKCP